MGYSPEELMSLSPDGIVSLVYQEDRAVFFKRMENRLRGEPAGASFEFRAIRKDGSIIWLSSLANRVDYDEQPAVQGMFLDINESKKAEEVVKKSEARYRELANFLPEIVFETDLSGKITFFSQTAFEITGFTPEEQEKGMNMLQFVVPEDRERAKENIRRRMTGEETDTSEYTLYRKNGNTYPAIVKTAPIFSENGLIGLRGLVIDITDRKTAEDKLRKSQKLTQKILDCSPNLIYVYDLSKNCNVYANKEILEFLGYTPEQIKSMGSELFAKILHPDDSRIVAEHHARFVNASDNVTYEVEYRMKHANGEWRWLRSRDVLFTRTKEGLGNQILGSTQDITERKKAEVALIEGEKTYRSLINGMSDSVWVVDFNGNFVDVNDAAVKVLGYSRNELLNLGIKDVDNYLTTEQAKAIMGQVASVGTQVFETIHTAKDGTEIPVEICSSLITYKGKQVVLGIARDISERKKTELELKQYNEVLERVGEGVDAGLAVISKDYHVFWANKRLKDLGVAPNRKCYETFNNLGVVCPDCGVKKIFENDAPPDIHEYKTVNSKGETTWIELRVTPLKDQNGVTMAALELAVPITERKKTEEELRKNQIKMEIMNEKLNVVGRLTRHDVGNKHMIMKSNVYLLKKQIGDNPKLIKYFEGIDLAIKQSDEMFEFSRIYEKIGVENPSEIDVAQYFDQAVALLPDLGTIKIVNDCQGLEVTADSLLKQLFYNLLDNSIKYGEKITQIRLHFTKEGGGVKLFYEDNGVGISKANKPKLFHEGFTTGKSTGVGLFLIKKMVEVYGWTITEEGEPANGAKFVITIPILNKNGKENFQIP